ncbi:MAG: response regulator transcription factor [Pyrinomonadaceae bacterium]
MPSHPPSHVLSVDDDIEACEMLSLLLKSHGIELTCAQSAAEAWPKIKAECFDLYLLDAWLPQTDGFELCRHIRESDSKTPILFYSGAAYDADKQTGMAAGANAYVTKPDLDGLIETMTGLIAKAGADKPVLRWVSNPPRPAQNWISSQFLCVETATD